MIGDLTVLGLITARGGSQGVPRKNLRNIAGRSLLERAIASGHAAQTLDRVILSSDDPEIIQAAILLGCDVPFVRPAELATGEARSIDVVRHALWVLPERCDLIVLLQPTSPFRTGADIDGAVRLCVESGAPACVSVCLPDKPPHWTFELAEGARMRPLMPDHYLIPRRQELPPAYAINGAVFVARSDWIVNQPDFVMPETVGYVMPKERSLDIDDEMGLAVAEALARHIERDAGATDAAPEVRAAAGRGRSSG